MSAISLTKSMNTLKKAYKGKNDKGVHVLDKSLAEDYLSFGVALHRLQVAIQTKELDIEDFYKFLEVE